MSHNSPSPLAGRTVVVRADLPNQDGTVHTYHVEDFWDRVTGSSWMNAVGNFAAVGYAVRSAFGGFPVDDEVLYGKVNGLGYLVHVSEVING